MSEKCDVHHGKSHCLNKVSQRIALIEPAVDAECLITEIFWQIRCSLSFLSYSLHEQGWETQLFHEEILNIDNRIEFIASHFPIAGISVTINTISRAVEIARKLKAVNNGIFIIFGGITAPHYSSILLGIGDCVIQGPGEAVLMEVVTNCGNSDYLRTIPGLIIKDSNNTPVFTDQNTSFIDHPCRFEDIHGFGGFSEKRNILGLRKPPLYSLFFSTGCVNRCKFCMSDRQYRIRKVDNVMADLNSILRFHKTPLPPRIMLVDDCPFGNMAIFSNLLKEFQHKRKSRKFDLLMQFHIRPILENPEILKSMRQAGVTTLLLGMETTSAKSLESQAKGTKPEDHLKVLQQCRNNGITPYGYFMAGFETDTPETIISVFDFIIKNRMVAQVLPMGIMSPEMAGCTIQSPSIRWTDSRMKSLDPFSFGASMKVSHRHPLISPPELQKMLIAGYDRIYSWKRVFTMSSAREMVYQSLFSLAWRKWRKGLLTHLNYLRLLHNFSVMSTSPKLNINEKQ
ncbi:MAG: hypothetical protein CVV64_10105 [Candidatus Wallbacteria bacterium HGW-Wallbacteria-1]|jgi:radical SAM superfamily enzyme YgiQ (UPF0313 family)|uniref:Elp3/MiaA/NifB-like radical SAM core domain-containing protein n=1 Tax=Candidatus Wallbacteria bacterium HGW-Wallbacteria-1 TaxID=2013854 RepID=A0A2N1PPP7_9BACT|nr:MAG: hypothetical protein CVV64_10105 [Candidatus Wallbacteria bacterium HGW-Wallbacteria-1]